VSRLVALDRAGIATLTGGLVRGDRSTSAIVAVNLRTGRSRPLGALALPVHDAAGVVADDHLLVFGGGATTSSDAVQRVGPGRHARVVGRLPQPRSDLAAVHIGRLSYVLGGYTGLAQLPAVLVTADGTSFRSLCRLPVTVRYAAVVAVGRMIWVIGGEHDGRAVSTIQRVDTALGTCARIGRLPHPLMGATALAMGGHIVIAGGQLASGRPTRSVVALDASGRRTRRVATLPHAVAFAAGVVDGTTGYVLGGEGPQLVDFVQLLTERSSPAGAGGTAA
jgi:hypothetical protein